MKQQKQRYLPNDDDRSLTRFYEGEFRKLHLKVFFIIVALIGGLYSILLNSRWLYQGITSWKLQSGS